MSLQSILQGYSQDINSISSHNNDVENEVRNRKAETIEEQFQHHLDAFNSGAQVLGTASGAYHLGRKAYNKYKDRVKGNKANSQPEPDTKPDASQPTGEDGSASGSTRADAANAGTDTSGGNAEANTLSQRADEVQARFQALKNRVQQGDAGTNPSAASDSSDGQQAAQAQAQDAQIQTNDAARVQAQAQSDSATQQANSASADAPAGDENPFSLKSFDPAEYGRQTGSATTSSVQGERQVEFSRPDTLGEGAEFGGDIQQPRSIGTTITRGAEQPSARVQSLTQDSSDLTGVGSDVDRGITIAQDTVNGVRSGVGNVVKNVANKVASGASKVLPESGSFLEGAGGAVLDGALDAIPVAGEIASIGMALYSLFSGDSHKTDPDKEDNTQSAIGNASTAIDPKALKQQAQGSIQAALV